MKGWQFVDRADRLVRFVMPRQAVLLRAWLGALAVATMVGGCAQEPSEPAEGAGAATAGEATVAEAASGTGTGDSLEYPRWVTTAPGDYVKYNQRTNLVQRGHLVYQKYCVGCHGAYGDGKGPAAIRLLTQPRDFTSGIYKFRSTDSGSLPLDSDLDRTITRGLARVSMPAFPLMPEQDKVAVIEYIKTFYSDWEEETEYRQLVALPQVPDDLDAPERLHRGRIAYLQMQCSKCHGVDGRGTGATQTEYIDAWGNSQEPFDFTSGGLKGGNTPEDIYRTFHTGLRSIMPSFGGDTLAAVTAEGFEAMSAGLDPAEVERLEPFRDQFPVDGAAVFSGMSEQERAELAERNSWDLVAYIISLRRTTSTADAVLATSAGG